ncbi:MAG TPA: hypothetical protein VNX25_03420, partial [Verrucomicrobiae bacterium]|nr:hypothetical protein [Verrucomicrobiae bacterium]
MKRLLRDIWEVLVVHAVAAHFSNGIVPVAVIFLLLALLTRDRYFEHTVQHLLVTVCCIVPVSFLSGVSRWRSRYRGSRTRVFRNKIRLALLLFLLTSCAAVIGISDPELILHHGLLAWLYGACLLA